MFDHEIEELQHALEAASESLWEFCDEIDCNFGFKNDEYDSRLSIETEYYMVCDRLPTWNNFSMMDQNSINYLSNNELYNLIEDEYHARSSIQSSLCQETLDLQLDIEDDLEHIAWVQDFNKKK